MEKPSEFGYVLGSPEDTANWGDRTLTKGGMWAPLELVVAPRYRGNFMFMGLIERPAGGPISLYKHHMTREYVNVDAEGRLYEYKGRGEEYVLLSLEDAKSRLAPNLLAALDEGVDISIDAQSLMQKLGEVLEAQGKGIPGLGTPRPRNPE